ncbi:MAG: flagellar basal body-associated FliL family protein [Gammaproteobacteria bacterium]|nr:flagellar basal body-associated FliL family protein [Gammaproteobacteria bacterium]
MKKWIFIGVGALLVIGASIGGSVVIVGAVSQPAATVVEVVEAPTEVFYYNIQPEFVVNFNSKERPRVLMVEISIATHDEETIVVLDDHTPELRNNLLLLLSAQTGPEMITVEGKNALREQVITVLNEIVSKHSKAKPVEDAYFIRFVLQ